MGVRELLSKIKSYVKLPETNTSQEQLGVTSIPTTNLLDLDTRTAFNNLEESIRAYKNPFNAEVKGATSTKCGYVEWAPTSIDFFVITDIPAGYKIVNRADYSLTLSMDSHFIEFIITSENRDVMIVVEDEKGNPQILDGMAKVNRMKLSGLLVYNSFLKGSEAMRPLTQQSQTGFSQQGTVFIDQTLGFVCDECPSEENPLKDYSITLVTGENIVVISGNQQWNVVEGSDEFFALLEDNDTQKMIGKKYTLIVSASPEPVS